MTTFHLCGIVRKEKESVMPSLGNWRKIDKGFEGEILLPGNNRGPVRVHTEPNMERDSADSPNYKLKTENGAEVGAVWERRSEMTGKTYLSVSYDNALEARKVDFNVVDKGNGQWEAIYSRNSMTRSNQAAEKTQEAKQEKQNAASEKTATKETGRTNADAGNSR